MTLLDTPRQASGHLIDTLPDPDSKKARIATFDDALLFWRLMPQGSVDYVENFYSWTGDFRDFEFGQPIAGAGPLTLSDQNAPQFVGRAEPYDHFDIHKQFYKGLIESGEWLTPANNPYYPIAWNPSNLEERYFRDLQSLTGWQVDLAKLSISWLGNSSIIDSWQHNLGRGELLSDGSYRLIAESPSSLQANVSIEDILVVEFDYELSSEEGYLSLFFDDILLWQSSDVEGEAYILLGDLYGQGQFTWLYDSNASGSYADVSGLTLLEIVDVRAVPEPSSITIVISMIALAGRRRRQRHPES
ncbi:MAG: hypothetical protein AAGB26_04060 [Planctomycetota bacterium]